LISPDRGNFDFAYRLPIWNIRSELLILCSQKHFMPKVKQFNKTKVLEAASTIFHQKGYNGTSIDEILKATGLSRSSLYDSFGDKHNLYLQSLEFYKNTSDQGMQTIQSKISAMIHEGNAKNVAQAIRDAEIHQFGLARLW